MIKRVCAIVVIGLIWIASICCPKALAREVFEVPRLKSVHIDGQADDWGTQGFRIDALAPIEGQLRNVDDFSAVVRLGWDADGLLVLASVSDDMLTVSADEIWSSDGVEIFLAESKGGTNMLQIVMVPGDGDIKPRTERLGYGQQVSRELSQQKIESNLVRTESGYRVEARMPWSSIGVTPEVGGEVAVQFAATDIDDGPACAIAWFPKAMTFRDTCRVHRIRLAEMASEPMKVAAWSRYDERSGKPFVEVEVKGSAEMVDEEVVIRHDGRVLARDTLQASDGWAMAVVRIPTPSRLEPFGKVLVSVAGKYTESVEVPDLHEIAAREMMDLAVVFEEHAFSGTEFPPCRVECSTLAHKLLGDYSIEPTYYDVNYNEVTWPKAPGRYGAVVTVRGENGINLTRNITLYRSAKVLPLWDRYGYLEMKLGGTIDFPEGMHVSDAQARRYAEDILRLLSRVTLVSNDHTSDLAVALAAMNESKGSTEPIDQYNDSRAVDRQWWVGLKRKLNGNDKRFTKKLVCPRPIKGKPALVLREGTIAEAGMKPDAAEKIDALLEEWAADSDQGFIACVARNGVIVLHKAYGERDGKVVGLHSASDIASITKLMQGIGVMMLVDQGLLDLNAPVGQYLPAIAEVPQLSGLTVRHLLTHTAGLSGIMGDFDPSFEHRIAEFGPFLKYGEKFVYNGKSLVLGSKVMEQVTGDALSQFHKAHLIDPLGCIDTQVALSYGDTLTTAFDLAKFGQMLLNGGAYGEMRFFSRETFEKMMLPRSLADITNGKVTRVWGIGCKWMDQDIFSNRTFGHGSATRSTLRIDLANNLVVSMTRRLPGKNYDKYHQKFLQVVADGMIDRK